MKTTTCRLVTLALLFASSAEAQSLFNNYQLMNLADDMDADLYDLESLSTADKKELQALTDKSATPDAAVQTLTSKATSTVMDGMKHFTSQLEELIKNKVASFTTTMLDSEKKEVEKKHKKSHKKHQKDSKPAKTEESEEESESEPEQEHKKKTKKKHHKKEKAPQSDDEEEEEKPKPKPKHHKKHHHAHKHHEKADSEKKQEETPSLEDLAKMISTLQNEQKKTNEPASDQVQLEEDFGLFPLPKLFKRAPHNAPLRKPAPKPAAQPKQKMSPEEILNRQAQMTQKKINDARLKVMNLKTSLEDAVREVKELSEMQAMTEGEMLGLHERMLAKEQALDMKLQLDYQNNLQELEKMRHQWGGAPQPMPMNTMLNQQQLSQMPAAHASGDMMENLMDQKRTDALLSWYAKGRGRNEQNSKVASMAKKLKRAAKLKDRAQQMQQLTGGSPSLESLRGVLAETMQNRMPQDMM